MNPGTKQDGNYDYLSAGFGPFLTRSIDDIGEVNLDNATDMASVRGGSRELNYDQTQTTGSLGSIVQVGSIQIDGVKGRITIYDDDGNEAVWIGDIDG